MSRADLPNLDSLPLTSPAPPQAHLVSDPSLLTAAGSILTVEARHQSFLNLLSGGTFEAQSFDLAFSPAQVLALVGGFLQGCQASDLCVGRLVRR